MTKLYTWWNNHIHANNIKEAWKIKAEEKWLAVARFFNHATWHAIDPSTIMLSTTWSDGRFENKAHPGVKSNFELQLITSSNHESEKVNSLITQMRDLVGFNLENIEHKRLWEDQLCAYKNNQDLIFPTRMFDSVAFFDPSSIRSELLKWVSQEIIADKRLTKKMLDRYHFHTRIMASWKDKYHWETYNSYNVESWEFYYNPEWNLYSVKNGPLRYVQYMLAVALMRYIHDSKSHPDFVEKLPTNIIERLQFIKDSSLTIKTHEEIDRMIEIYEFFLHIYHEMQYRHFSENITDFIIEDRDVLKDIRDMLNCLQHGCKIGQFFILKK